MFCTECGVRNPDSSKFCRDCGRKIVKVDEASELKPSRPSQALNIEAPLSSAQASDRLRQLLDMAFWHSEAGHLNSALTACDAALKIDPESSSALSLMGCIFEKQGNDEKAIEAFEKIVSINPDSAADVEKLEHLRRGIRNRAVTPSLMHQLTPPALLEASRKYPAMPIVAAIAAGFIVLILAAGFMRRQPSQAATQSPSQISGPAPALTRYTGNPNQIASSIPAPGLPVSQQGTVAAPPPPSAGDPFGIQNPGVLNRLVSAQRAAPNRRDQTNGGTQLYGQAPTMPSSGSIQPLTVSPTDVPDHVVAVNPQRSAEPDHVVMVSPNDNDGTTAAATDSAPSDSDQPAPPASHIFITVHGTGSDGGSNGETPLPNDSGTHAITLSENAGASLQQKGLNLQEGGNYKAAQAAYESAIAAFQQDIVNGRNVDEASRGIEACKVAVEICKQSQ
jgi:tetratricopeptide (TPR) repeat protein